MANGGGPNWNTALSSSLPCQQEGGKKEERGEGMHQSYYCYPLMPRHSPASACLSRNQANLWMHYTVSTWGRRWLLVERENKYGRYFLYSLCPAVKRKDLNSQLNISFRNSTILGHMMIRITIKTRMNHSLIPRRLELSWEWGSWYYVIHNYHLVKFQIIYM